MRDFQVYDPVKRGMLYRGPNEGKVAKYLKKVPTALVTAGPELKKFRKQDVRQRARFKRRWYVRVWAWIKRQFNRIRGK